ncbi:TPA: hypothetical protein ACKPYB_000650 [Stenotrophomonas maltophilia]
MKKTRKLIDLLKEAGLTDLSLISDRPGDIGFVESRPFVNTLSIVKELVIAHPEFSAQTYVLSYLPHQGVVFKEYESVTEAIGEMVYEDTKRVIAKGQSKVAVLVERNTGDHLVTDDELLEAFEAFSDYSQKFGRREIETVVNFAFQIMNGDYKNVWE